MRLSDIVSQQFRTSEAASKKNDELATQLGAYRYGPARLALALSLADKTPVSEDKAELKGASVRGRQLFGNEDSMAAWVAMITEHAGRSLDLKEFPFMVAAHWERGINILFGLWVRVDRDFDKFLSDLILKSGATARARSILQDSVKGLQPSSIADLAPVILRLGEIAEGKNRGEESNWKLNADGQPPHVAIMGASGGGKTHLGLQFAEKIQEQSGCATFIFDMKGDIVENTALREKLGAEITEFPGGSVPLDILYVSDRKKKHQVQNVAGYFCSSMSSITGKAGNVQMDRLRQIVAAEIMSAKEGVSISRLREAVREHYEEKGITHDSVISALNLIDDFDLFSPDQSPAEFFGRSRIFVMNEAAPEIQRFCALILLDALSRHFTDLPEAAVADGYRQIKILLVVDEAHRVLGFKHRALADILRISRSKGGAAMLISQSPNDYMSEDVNFLENIGLRVCYETTATAASITRVFAESVKVSRLGRGVCYARLSGHDKPIQKIKVW